jgi:hypothetical protein
LLLKIYECVNLPAQGANVTTKKTSTLHSLTTGIYDASTKVTAAAAWSSIYQSYLKAASTVASLTETGSAMVNSRDQVLQISGERHTRMQS